MIDRIELDGVVLSVRLRKGVKAMRLRADAHGDIVLTVPPRVSEQQAAAFLEANRAFLRRELARVRRTVTATFPKTPHTGDTVPWHGGVLTLHVGGVKRTTLSGDTLYLPSAEALPRWYHTQAADYLTAFLRDVYARRFADGAVEFPREVRVRAMTSRWGSCAPKAGVVTLNTYLLGADDALIEYVCVHELTHFLHPDHSAAFYAEMDVRLPNHRDLTARLNGK